MTAQQSLVEFIPHAAAVIDARGGIVRVNSSFVARFEERFIHRQLTDVLQDFDQKPGAWRPSGYWRDDRIVLERGVRYADESCTLIPIDRGYSLFVCAGTPRASELEPSVEIDAMAEALLQGMDHAAFLVHADGRIIAHNTLALSFLRADVLRGVSLDDALTLYREEEVIELSALVRHALAHRREASLSTGLRLERDSSDQSPEDAPAVSITILPIEHRPVAVVVAKNEEESRRIRGDLRYLQHAENVVRTAGGIAHQLRNGCTALAGQLELLREEIGRPLPALFSAVRRIERLGYRLGSFSDRGRVQRNQEHQSSEDFEESVINAVDLALSGTSVRATFNLEPFYASPQVTPEDISQIIFNLVTNSVDAMPDGGTVHVETTVLSDDQTLGVTIRDEGHGMDPRLLPDVVKPYFTTKERGIGMGLTITRSILEEIGGTLSLSTDPGFGTTADVSIPLMEKDGSDTSCVGRKRKGCWDEATVLELTACPVLLVEDDMLVRRFMEHGLQHLGCDVTTVENGDRALPVLQDRLKRGAPFRLLITDLTMPGRLDGVELLRRAREYDPELPAILSTGTLSPYRGQSHREAGFQAVLRKPFGLQQLQESVCVAFRAAG